MSSVLVLLIYHYNIIKRIDHNLIKEINGKLQPIIEEIARNKINKFIINSPWIQGILYRPPTETQKAGRMYKTVESHFNRLSNENTSKQSLFEI